MSLDRRWHRRFCFDLFADNAVEWFGRAAQTDPRHGLMADIYAFKVSPRGRYGGKDRRTVEVFYGQRPFENITEMVDQAGGLPIPRERLLVERGASLIYQRGDNGTVVCTLVPAITENFRQEETGIILQYFADTSSLTGLPKVQEHWRCLMSYLQCTSIDGEPTFGDKLRVGWLRWTRPMIVAEKLLKPRYRTVISQVLYWVLTVGLSGTVLFALQWLFRDTSGKS